VYGIIHPKIPTKIKIIGNVFNSAGFFVYAMINITKPGKIRVNKVKIEFGLPSPFREFILPINTKAAPWIIPTTDHNI